MLHNAGHHVSHDAHHKHSYYLIRNGELLGYTESEIEAIANLARYHRKSEPKKKHDNFQRLDSERLKTGVFNLPKAKKYDYFRENNHGTRKGTPVVFLKNTEIIA